MTFEETIRQIVREENEQHFKRIEQLLKNNETQQYPPMLTVNEAAQILKMGKSSVYELTHRIDFPCVRDGRKVRIPYRKLIQWIEANSATQQAI